MSIQHWLQLSFVLCLSAALCQCLTAGILENGFYEEPRAKYVDPGLASGMGLGPGDIHRLYFAGDSGDRVECIANLTPRLLPDHLAGVEFVECPDGFREVRQIAALPVNQGQVLIRYANVLLSGGNHAGTYYVEHRPAQLPQSKIIAAAMDSAARVLHLRDVHGCLAYTRAKPEYNAFAVQGDCKGYPLDVRTSLQLTPLADKLVVYRSASGEERELSVFPAVPELNLPADRRGSLVEANAVAEYTGGRLKVENMLGCLVAPALDIVVTPFLFLWFALGPGPSGGPF